jgi:proteasome activator subunit 4
MAFDILALADEWVDKLGSLLESRSFGDKVWSNEFCRALSALDKVLRGSYNLIMEIDSRKTGGLSAER